MLAYLRVYWKTLTEFRGMLAVVVIQWILQLLLFLAFWQGILGVNSHLETWSTEAIVCLVGFGYVFSGLRVTLLTGIFNLSDKVVNGRLDTLMARPQPLWISLIGSELKPFGLVEVLIGIILCLYGIHAAGQIVATDVIAAVAMSAEGFFVYGSYLVLIEVLSFRLGRIGGIVSAFDSVTQLIDYPMNYYPPVAKGFFTYAVPLIFVSTFPALCALGELDRQWHWVLVGIAICGSAVAASVVVWRRGLAHYTSTGN